MGGDISSDTIDLRVSHAAMMRILQRVDSDVKRGEPCPMCSQAPHAAHCSLVSALKRAERVF